MNNLPVVPQTGTVPVESGVIVVADPTVFEPPSEEFSDSFLGKIVDSGTAQIFGTGGDGGFDVEFYVTDNTNFIESLEGDNELISKTSVVVIKVPSGKLNIADLHDVNTDRALVFNVQPGNYEVRVFFTQNDVDFYGFKIVLTPTTKVAMNNIGMMETLG